MQIKIKDNARLQYIGDNRNKAINWEWADMLGQIQGMTIKVETDYLFTNQFNTVPIPGVSDNGMRIMNSSVEYVIDDIRENYMRCNWCGKPSPVWMHCKHCGRSDHLEFFTKRWLGFMKRKVN